MLRTLLLQIFGLADIIAKQQYALDMLWLQCELYQELATLDAEIIRKIAIAGEKWEANDVY